MTTYARRTGRVVLLDSLDRLLLLRCALAPGNPEKGHAWFTPGGGLEPGEDPAEGAARELHEEVGLSVSTADLSPVAFTSGTSAELATTTETVYPHRLTELVTDIIAGRTHTEPIELPWHH
ncbi:NUDIX domain-containing protein [Actinoplanes sp. CA-054009]